MPHPFPSSDDAIRRLVEEAQDIIYRCDVTGRFTYVNRTAVRVMRYADTELIGRHYLTLVREDFRPLAERWYRHQFESRTANTYYEFAAVTKTGETLWLGQHVQLICEGDRVIAFQAIARDITRQHEAEESLRRSEARYRSLIAGANYAIFRTNADNTFVDVNPALIRLLGYGSADEVLAMRETTPIYADPNDRTRLIAECLREGRLEGKEVPWKRRDGSLVTVRLSARTVHDENSRFVGFEVIAEDVSERRRIEERLRQAEKLDAVSQLAAGVAHHFNNLLMSILGYTELLLMRHGSNAEDREDLEQIERAGNRAAALTRQLLAFSRKQPSATAVVDVNALIGEVDNELRPLLPSNVRLIVDRPAAPVHVAIDPHDMSLVVRHLVLNARDAMPRGGDIRLVLNPMSADVQLVVTDTGTGMSPDTRAHLFEPFFTTKEQLAGTGLGLAAVYGIVHENRGSISVDSAVGIGTTVTVHLPRANPPTANPGAAQSQMP